LHSGARLLAEEPGPAGVLCADNAEQGAGRRGR